MENMNKIHYISLILITFIVSGCYVAYDPIYDTKRVWVNEYVYEDHPHTTEVYWYTDYELGGTPYFGYWDSFYYYYGVPHFYPWWYYYQFIPPYHYYSHSHIHVHCNNGHYVYGHRGPTINNNVAKDFTPTIKIKNNKDKSIVFPRDWKSHNSTRNTKQNNWWNKVNINQTNYNRTFNFNNKINKGNNGSKRTNKTNTSRKPKR